MTQLLGGTVHTLPADLQQALLNNPLSLSVWNTLTPLARNEWICWVESPKRAATRSTHVERTVTELTEGIRRPCCWIGCIHRTDKAVSPSVQGILDKRSTIQK